VELSKIKLFNTFAGILFFGVCHQKIELASSIILERVYLTSLKLLTIFYYWVKLNGYTEMIILLVRKDEVTVVFCIERQLVMV